MVYCVISQKFEYFFVAYRPGLLLSESSLTDENLDPNESSIPDLLNRQDSYHPKPLPTVHTRLYIEEREKPINPLYIGVPVAGACVILALLIFTIFLLRRKQNYSYEDVFKTSSPPTVIITLSNGDENDKHYCQRIQQYCQAKNCQTKNCHTKKCHNKPQNNVENGIQNNENGHLGRTKCVHKNGGHKNIYNDSGNTSLRQGCDSDVTASRHNQNKCGNKPDCKDNSFKTPGMTKTKEGSSSEEQRPFYLSRDKEEGTTPPCVKQLLLENEKQKQFHVH